MTQLQNVPTGTWVNMLPSGQPSGTVYHLRYECGLSEWSQHMWERVRLETKYPQLQADDLVRLMRLDPCQKCKEWLNRPTAERVIQEVARGLGWVTVDSSAGCTLHEEIDRAGFDHFIEDLSGYGYKIVPMTKKERKEAGLDW